MDGNPLPTIFKNVGMGMPTYINQIPFIKNGIAVVFNIRLMPGFVPQPCLACFAGINTN